MARPGGEAVSLFASLRGYRVSWLPGDAAAAATLAAIAIPEQLATAGLIGMPPASGLLAFAAGTLAYAAFGANRFLSVGADSTIAPVIAGALASIAVAGSTGYAGLAASLALLVGAILIASHVFRLGWIADLLSIPVTTGFLAGIAVHIVGGQLPSILGIDAPAGSLPERIAAIAQHLPDARPAPLAIGLGVVAAGLAAERLDRRIPGPLLGLGGTALFAWWFGAGSPDIALLGGQPLTMPSLTLAIPSWHEFTYLVPLSFMIALLCMMQTAAVAKAFSTDQEWRDDASREFAAVGVGSILAGLVGAFPVNASPPRTAIASESGGRSQLTGIIAVLIGGGAMAVAGRAFAHVPQAALGGVLVFIAIRIVRAPLMARIYRESPLEAILVIASAALVVLLPIEVGVGLSIALSVLHSIYTIARPHCTELARVPGTTIWWADTPERPGEHEPGIVVFALGAPLNFINTTYMVRRLMDAVAARSAVPSAACRFVVIEANGVIGIDFTGALIFGKAVEALRARGIAVAVARLESQRALDAAERTGLVRAIGRERIFRSVEEAVRAWKAA